MFTLELNNSYKSSKYKESMAKEFQEPEKEGVYFRDALLDGFMGGLGIVAAFLVSALVFLFTAPLFANWKVNECNYQYVVPKNRLKV